MRQDAIRRVQEMQRRARYNVENSNKSMNSPLPQDIAVVDANSANVPQPQTDIAVEKVGENQNYFTPIVQEAETLIPEIKEEELPRNEPTNSDYNQEDSLGNNSFNNSPSSRNYNGSNHNSGFNSSNNTSGNSGGITSFISGILGQNGGGFSTQSIKDAVENLKNNFGETVSSTISSVSSPITSIMDKFGLDSDKLIIIGVILVLLNEKGDKTLLLALGYLLLS